MLAVVLLIVLRFFFQSYFIVGTGFIDVSIIIVVGIIENDVFSSSVF